MAPPTLTEERERDGAEIALLEELWAAPAARKERPGRSARARAWLSGRLGHLVAIGWLAFVVSVMFQPAPADPAAAVPLWAEWIIVGFFLALGAAGVLAVTRPGPRAWAAAATAGTLGVALGVGCLTTAHHATGWAAYELAATGVLASLAVSGLLRRRP